MGKSYNRNQDKHNKYDRERQQRDSRKNKFVKNNGQRKSLTDVDDQFNVRNVFRDIYSDEASY